MEGKGKKGGEQVKERWELGKDNKYGMEGKIKMREREREGAGGRK